MRQFLPIKGPGGRAPTTKEKTALVVLSVTLILLVLTLLNGDAAFADEPARNPVFSVVGNLAQTTGVGILAAYAIVLLWSGLIFFKGERVAESRPLPGRALATLGITIGLSGMLGIAQLDAAGSLGSLVGGAIGGAFGSTFGVVVLMAMLLLGVHLAGQGAWSAFRGVPVASAAAPTMEPSHSGTAAGAPPMGGFSLPEASPRVGSEPVVVDDGDPTADERTLAVTQAMDEIERSRGVTIVDVEPEGLQEPDSADENLPAEEEIAGEIAGDSETEDSEGEPELAWEQQPEEAVAEVEEEETEESPPSIGEEVDALDVPEPETEEAQVQAGLDLVNSALADEPETAAAEEEVAEDVAEEVEETEQDEEEEDAEEELEVSEAKAEFESEPEKQDLGDDDLEEEEVEGEEQDDEWDDEAAVEEDEDSQSANRQPTIAQPYLFPVHRREADEEPEENDRESDDENDLAAVEHHSAGSVATESADDEAEPAESTADATSNFDWRGRPVD